MKNKATFKVFRDIIQVIMNLDSIDASYEEELINAWFEAYKDTKYFDVIEWAKFWFADVNRDTHDYWLDKRGLMLWELKGMIHVSGIFPTF